MFKEILKGKVIIFHARAFVLRQPQDAKPRFCLLCVWQKTSIKMSESAWVTLWSISPLAYASDNTPMFNGTSILLQGLFFSQPFSTGMQIELLETSFQERLSLGKLAVVFAESLSLLRARCPHMTTPRISCIMGKDSYIYIFRYIYIHIYTKTVAYIHFP